MQTLTRASNELFRRTPDECFATLQAIWEHTHKKKEHSVDHWHPPQNVRPRVQEGRLAIAFGEGAYRMNDWSFAQLCRLAGVSKDTLNRLSPETACSVFDETIPSAEKPLQILTTGESVRSIHGVAYTRLWDVDLLTMLREFATDFQPPHEAAGGGTGLYAGEQDMFLFLIDPLGWTEIDGEAFAPGFFCWNSEVGRRSVGVQTFWYQMVCGNHLVWDAIEVVEFKRKHTANVHECLNEIRRLVEGLVEKRDARKDGFAATIKKAMETKLGTDADEVLKVLGQPLTQRVPQCGTDRKAITELRSDRCVKGQHDITRTLAKQAIEIAKEKGAFTVFAVVDALTRLSAKFTHAGERAEADEKAGRLLALAA